MGILDDFYKFMSPGTMEEVVTEEKKQVDPREMQQLYQQMLQDSNKVITPVEIEREPTESMTYETNVPKNEVPQFLIDSLTRLKNMTPEERKEADRRAEEAMTYERSRGAELIPEGADMSKYINIPVDDEETQDFVVNENPVEDFGGVNLGTQSAKQRKLDDTIADEVLTDSQLKDEKADTVPTISQMYPRGTNLIRLFESKNKSGKPYLEAYKDPSTGIMTIGLGNTKIDGRAVKKGDKITYDKAIQLFNESLRESIDELNDLKSFLPEGVKFSKGFESALISILHNSSPKKIKFIKDKKTGKLKETRGFKALKKGDLKSFSKELFDPKVGIVSAGGKVRKGLISRRQEELQFLDPSERYDIK